MHIPKLLLQKPDSHQVEFGNQKHMDSIPDGGRRLMMSPPETPPTNQPEDRAHAEHVLCGLLLLSALKTLPNN